MEVKLKWEERNLVCEKCCPENASPPLVSPQGTDHMFRSGNECGGCEKRGPGIVSLSTDSTGGWSLLSLCLSVLKAVTRCPLSKGEISV